MSSSDEENNYSSGDDEDYVPDGNALCQLMLTNVIKSVNLNFAVDLHYFLR